MNVVVINYGTGNLGSIRRALEECGGDVRVSECPAELREADRIVLPGVGAFADGMARLRAGGWVSEIEEALRNPRVALLGICLGMQLLGDSGDEGGMTTGLGLIPGDVRRLEPDSLKTKIPHVGWNEAHFMTADPLFASIPGGTDFYFVHSYHLAATAVGSVLAKTPYCGGFVSAVRSANIWGTQFHPEKSSRSGFQLLRNFLSAQIHA